MNVLLVHNHLASFVQTDIDLLKSAHQVRVMHFQHHASALVSSIAAAKDGVGWSDVVVSWFGGFHAFFVGNIARLFKKPHIIVASGYDVADMPDIDYGNMRPGLRRPVGQSAFRQANMVLPVSRFAAGELKRNVGDLGAKVQVVHHGFCTDEESAGMTKKRRVATIAGLNRETQKLKGIQVLFDSASQMPDVEFVLVGGASDGSLDQLRAQAPPNMTLTGHVPNAHRSDWLTQSKVYAQLSRFESFGCGLAEAMIQGCVPVVTNCAALPEVAGDTGFYTRYGDVDATVRAIQQALATPPGYGARARERILTEFPLEKRRVKLLAALDAVRLLKQSHP